MECDPGAFFHPHYHSGSQGGPSIRVWDGQGAHGVPWQVDSQVSWSICITRVILSVGSGKGRSVGLHWEGGVGGVGEPERQGPYQAHISPRAGTEPTRAEGRGV